MPTTTYILSPVKEDTLQQIYTLLRASLSNSVLLVCYTLKFAHNVFGKVQILKETPNPHKGANYAWFWVKGLVFNWTREKKEIVVALPVENIQNQSIHIEVTQILESLGFWRRSNLPYYLIPISFAIIAQIALSLWLTPLGLGILVVALLAIFLAVGSLILIFSIRQRGSPIPPFLEVIRERGSFQKAHEKKKSVNNSS